MRRGKRALGHGALDAKPQEARAFGPSQKMSGLSDGPAIFVLRGIG
jgi:hypothetical protein